MTSSDDKFLMNAPAPTPVKQYLLIAGGALAGGALGATITWLLARQGLHAAAVPGGLLGLGAGFFWHRTWAIPILGAIAALILGVVVEWALHPFIADRSFAFFVQNVHQLPKQTLLMIAIGGAVGFYGPFRAMASAPR
jgi:ABC-type transport system involved in cytochrome c biogenesis permease subunit